MIVEREAIVEFFEATAGSRMMVNYMRFGGVAYDLPTEFRNMPIMQFLDQLINDRLPRFVDEIHTYLTGNEIVRGRGIGVGVLVRGRGNRLQHVRSCAARSGVPYDVRRAEPYSYYDTSTSTSPCATTATSSIAT
jgi:NADH-quinone oxidoreductase subunit C/D